ncbi:MAG: hypothetical protein RLZ98_1288 [Pseudomonadota bacterium]|jgi:hypothetical protein
MPRHAPEKTTEWATWGEGWADAPLALLQSRVCWRSVSTDQLVFLIPALTADATKRKCAGRKAGVAAHLEWVLQERVRANGRPVGNRSRFSWWPGTRQEGSSWHENELRAIQCMLHPKAAQSSVGEAVSGSIHAGINAAYVFPDLQYMHETFTAAGWLGMVARGRPALLTTELAAIIEDIVLAPSRVRVPNEIELMLIDRVHAIDYHARFQSIVSRVLENGRTTVVRRALPPVGRT